MEIKNKLYPYPVLSYFSQEYKESSIFEIKPDIIIEGYRETVVFQAVLVNSELQRLVQEGKAEIILHIECGQTGYRHILKFKSDTNQLSWTIPNDQVSGRVQICPFIVAACNITGYTNNEFEDDLAGMTFDLESGTILAVARQIDVRVKKRSEDLRDLPSIFNISENTDSRAQCMKISYQNEQLIQVLLPRNDWQKFESLNSTGKLTGVFSSIIAVPALQLVLEDLKKMGSDQRKAMAVEPTIWFTCIADTLRNKFQIDITGNEFDKKEPYELAQEMINDPLDRALNELWKAK